MKAIPSAAGRGRRVVYTLLWRSQICNMLGAFVSARTRHDCKSRNLGEVALDRRKHDIMGLLNE